MFGSFGCCDNFRDCHHREREVTIANIARKREKQLDHNNQLYVTYLLAFQLEQSFLFLSIRGNGTFNNVIFEGFANGVALFSALARNNKDNKDNNKDDKNNQNRNTFTGILRVCPTDIVAIAI